ncbi:hypothetical protein A0H81_12502 [Grifola frondosa]|uniref:F-box domain-containing protein n=1 Tax=Grifola frondosa TaxID=5627 RepID=A0A1C7LUL2_GRIFR|nr:hypothetical protein A0H81_12502 [Grifola frondosa]
MLPAGRLSTRVVLKHSNSPQECPAISPADPSLRAPPSRQVQQHVVRLNLENIDEDVLYLILDRIQTFGLRSTSMVSRRLRYACLPFMFRICTLGFIKSGDIFPPPRIWSYTRMVKLLWAPNYFPQFCANFDILLPHLHTLHTISFKRCDKPLPWHSLQVLFSMPALQTLEMTYTQWPPESPFDIKVLSSMQLSLLNFDYEGCHSFWSRPKPDDLILREAHWVWWMLERSRSTLESVRMPSETTQYALMAAQTWPRLRQLILYGFSPGPDISLLSLLAVMPSLTSLTLKLAQSTLQPSLLLWPRGSRRDIDLSNLRYFIISYPHPDDEIFAHLPSELRGISIRDSPRYYIHNKCVMAPNRTPLLSGTDLLRMLNTRTFAALERLEIVYRADSSDSQLPGSIVNMFPELRFLEIHRYPSHDNERYPLDIVTTLSRLKKLRVLHLNLHSSRWPSWEVIPEPLDVLGERAQVVAGAFSLSQLSEVAFLRRNHHENYWATWSSYGREFFDETGPVYRSRK